MSVDDLAAILESLARIEAALAVLVQTRTVKEWYSTGEAAERLGRAEYTIREWCRLGRAQARKKPCGRGKGGEWLISHAELERLCNEGPLPTSRLA
jgi:hypothetical protein